MPNLPLRPNLERTRSSSPGPRRCSEPVAPSGQHNMAVRGHDQTAVVDPHPSQRHAL